jgi:hypothetical protein
MSIHGFNASIILTASSALRRGDIVEFDCEASASSDPRSCGEGFDRPCISPIPKNDGRHNYLIPTVAPRWTNSQEMSSRYTTTFNRSVASATTTSSGRISSPASLSAFPNCTRSL